MDRKRRLILVFLCAAALVVVAIVQYTNSKSDTAAASASKPKAGYPAPVIDLPNLQDETVTVGGKSDQIQLINFWAAWCGPCELEAPDLQSAFEKYGDQIAFRGVNSTKYDRERDARNFVDEQKLTFPILMDREGDATDEYKVKSYPTTFVVDKNGTIVERIEGVMTEEDVARIVKEYANT